MISSLRTIAVELSQNPYPIAIGSGSLSQIGALLRGQGVSEGTKALIITNPVVQEHYGNVVLNSLRNAKLVTEQLVIKAGEDQKTPATLACIHDAAFQHRLERGSYLLALGGGVVGDLTGFAAATWLRGIPLIQVPTTLLAMVDAAIGGKTGVNHPGGKNLIGAFHQPRLVLIDPDTLATLPRREFRAGMAEVIKYGIINDPDLFLALETAQNLSSLEGVGGELLLLLLERSAAAKAKVVAADEREGGLRATLNYGHTLGHVVETLCGYGRWLHGEAVAIGMVAAGEIAVAMNLWSRTDQTRQINLIRAAGLPVEWPELSDHSVLECLKRDKKVRGGKVRFVLPTGIGAVEIRDDVSESTILSALKQVRHQQA